MPSPPAKKGFTFPWKFLFLLFLGYGSAMLFTRVIFLWLPPISGFALSKEPENPLLTAVPRKRAEHVLIAAPNIFDPQNRPIKKLQPLDPPPRFHVNQTKRLCIYAPPPPKPTKISKVRYILRSSLRKRLQSHFKFRGNRDQFTEAGLFLLKVRPNSFYEALGLQSLDEVLQINGAKANNISAWLQLYKKLLQPEAKGKLSSLHIEFNRRRQRHQLHNILLGDRQIWQQAPGHWLVSEHWLKEHFYQALSTSQNRAKFHWSTSKNKPGLMLTWVQKRPSDLRHIGFESDDRLVSINATPLQKSAKTSLKALAQSLQKQRLSKITLSFYRGQTKYIRTLHIQR